MPLSGPQSTDPAADSSPGAELDAPFDIAIIGAGPIGIETAIACRKAGLRVLQIDAGQVGEQIYRFPPDLRFFSSPERIAIAGVPIQTLDQSKCTREEYLAYLRAVVLQFDLDIRTFERVDRIARTPDGFTLRTQSQAGQHTYDARRLVLATGGTTRPRTLNIPGEDLPHVSHHLAEGHRYFQRRVVIIGGKNSAVEAALRCYRVDARVTMSYRREEFPSSVKYWLLPEIKHLIRTGAIDGRFRTQPVEITPTHITLRDLDSGEEMFIPADEVLLMVGYEADMSLFRLAGVHLSDDAEQQPEYNPETMETNVKNVFIAGTATAGTQRRFAVYLENCHVHAERIVAAIEGRAAEEPEPSQLITELPEN